MKNFTFLVVGGFIIFLALLVTPWVSAQGTGTNWTKPTQLSSQTGQVDNQIIFADPFGYVHLFWPETDLLEEQTILYYSRFDGETWTLPVDIFIAPNTTRISADVDLDGILYLLYTNRLSGEVYYTRAALQEATSAQGWQKPIKLDIYAAEIDLKVDSEGAVHVLYSGKGQGERGIYFMNSIDAGQTWSDSIWLDPDIPSDLEPRQIQLEIGEENSLHVSWFYWDQNFLGRWIRYSHSFDQGKNWSNPFTIDQVEPGSEDLRLPAPSMVVNGRDVHLVWAGDFITHRKHRVSKDSGQTWNQAQFIFGDLHGLAITDGVASDGLGRIHFFGQIRWPQGIYHGYWSDGRWSSPQMIYLITQGDSQSLGERIHAHKLRATVRAGNQLVVTFTTSPSEPRSILYEMHMTLTDVPDINLLPLPEEAPALTSDSELVFASPTLLPEIPTETPNLNTLLGPVSSRDSSPASGLIWGIIPALILIAAFIVIRFVFRKNS